MTCEEAREAILDAAMAGHVSGHLTSCESCRSFLMVQRSLDEQLSRAYFAPPPAPGIRAAICTRVKAEKRRRIREELLPAVIAPAAGVVMSGVCAFLIPDLAGLVLTAGLAAGVLSYGGQLLFTWLTEELGEG